MNLSAISPINKTWNRHSLFVSRHWTLALNLLFSNHFQLFSVELIVHSTVLLLPNKSHLQLWINSCKKCVEDKWTMYSIYVACTIHVIPIALLCCLKMKSTEFILIQLNVLQSDICFFTHRCKQLFLIMKRVAPIYKYV